MNRTIWIARLMAVLILLVFALLMTNLYSKLRQMQQPAERPRAVQPAP